MQMYLMPLNYIHLEMGHRSVLCYHNFLKFLLGRKLRADIFENFILKKKKKESFILNDTVRRQQ